MGQPVSLGEISSCFDYLPELANLLAEMFLPDVTLSSVVWMKKQGLHSGMSSELMLMWERASVQCIVEEGRRASRRMRRRQGRRNKVESSIVDLSTFLKFLSKGFRTAGVKM